MKEGCSMSVRDRDGNKNRPEGSSMSALPPPGGIAAGKGLNTFAVWKQITSSEEKVVGITILGSSSMMWPAQHEIPDL